MVRRWMRTPVAVVAVTTLVAVVDVLAGERIVLIGLLSVGPLLAAIFLSPAQTVGVGVYAIVLAVVLGASDDILGTADHAGRLATVTAVSALSLWAARIREEREEATAQLVRVANVAQRAILRTPPPRLGRVALAARYVSATEGALVGGDLYETAYTPMGVRLMIGDARGKGLEAVEVAAAVMGAFREVALAEHDLRSVVEAIDARIGKALGPEDFVTCLILEALHDSDVVRVANCGHHPPIAVTSAGANLLETPRHGRPLGLDPDCGVDELTIPAGTRLVLYTDGLVEARDRRGEELDLLVAPAALLAGDVDVAADDLLGRLRMHVGGRLHDDIAVMVVDFVA